MLILLTVLIGGCTISRNKPAEALIPTATVSSNTAEVGEFVQARMTSGFIIPEPNSLEEQTILGVVFGLCFIPSERLISDSEGFCDTLSVPGGFTVADDEPLFVVKDVTVRRGETVEVSHSVQLTASEAGGVTVVGYLGTLDEDGESIEPIYNLQTKRAFVEFE